MGYPLPNLYSASGVSEGELASPEVVRQVEFDLVVGDLADWSAYEKVGGITELRYQARREWGIGKVYARCSRLDIVELGRRVRKDSGKLSVHCGTSRDPIL
jgi:hypothetical protein